LPVPTEEPSSTPPGPVATGPLFIAYVRDGQLLVTDLTYGLPGGTTQYTAPGLGDQVQELVWSPSGEFIAFVSPVQGIEHLFYIFAQGESSPTDLGPGSSPAWSPDSQSIAYIGGSYPDDNIWVTTIDNPSPRPLSFETNHAWGRPAFTPDGQALIVATVDRMNMGAQGNTSFVLEQLALDGSGTRVPLPGAAPFEGGRLPYDLRFSPDGARLAFSTSMHYSACASPGAYYVSDPQGGNRQEYISPSLKPSIDPTNERYHVGLSYAWSPGSDTLVTTGTVVDCKFDSPTMGQPVAGPEMSVLQLDGSEGTVIPGMFHSPSMDRSRTMIAAAHYLELGDMNPNVEIYSAQTGELMMELGPGRSPQFQP
jgi:dipeptidyl aminopeptidase/acylaminoacyl peptidase